MPFLLEIPFEDRKLASHFKCKWSKERGAWVYPGATLPEALKQYLPKEYSWVEYQTHKGQGNQQPVTDTGIITLRDDQKENANDLLNAFEHGAPEVVVASKTGTGKTFTALHVAMSLPHSGKILIVCPKAVIPAWRESINKFGNHGKRFCIINYESLKSLIKAPPVSGKDTKRAKTKSGERNRKRRINQARASQGTSYVKWDVIIDDETHYLTNPNSQRSQAMETIIRSNPDVRLIRSSATIGSDPSKLGYLARGFAWRTGGRATNSAATVEQWYEWCERKNIDVELTTWGKTTSLKWNHNDRDLKLINHLLFGGDIKWAVRADPKWDKTPRYQVPIELDIVEKDAYEETWHEFQQTIKEIERLKADKTTKGSRQKATQKGLAALIRYRQKVGLLKAPYIAEYVKDLLDSNEIQVAISCEFMGTVDLLLDKLDKTKTAEFTGRTEATREQERLSFQQNKKPIIIFTPSEGFNLHQGEITTDDVPRIQICAEPSWSPIKGLQKEGRTNRNGMIAPVIYPSAVDTTDYKIIHALLQGYDNMDTMMGDEKTVIQPLASLIGTSSETLLG